MNKDLKLVWVVEYLIGIGFLVTVLPSIVNPQPGWSHAHSWAYLLFIVCTGIALISSASATRQRIELSKRIGELEKKLSEKSAQNQAQTTHGAQFISKEHLIGSVN
jgi:threonine/homoserine/homoserine lactone efflux protein